MLEDRTLLSNAVLPDLHSMDAQRHAHESSVVETHTVNAPDLPGLTVTDADSANLTGATVSITGGFQSGQDMLEFTNQNGISLISNSTGVLTLGGQASVAEYQAALRSVKYRNSSDSPNTSNRTISFKVNDGTSDSNTATKTVTITAINDDPTIVKPGDQSVNEDTDLVFSSGNGNAISIADVDAGSATVKATLTATNSKVTLATTSGLTIVSGSDGSGSVGFTGTLADINAALNGLKFRGNQDYNGPASLAIDVDDQDNSGTGGAKMANATVLITVQPVPEEPGEIHGTTWNDLDRDGGRDAGEPGLPDWTIYVDLNANGQREDNEPFATTRADDLATSTIDEAGTYTLTVPAGTYSIREVPQSGWTPTFPRSLGGELTFVELHQDNVAGVDGLYSAKAVAISPDGKFVYVAGRSDNALSVFSRDTETGKLSFVQVVKDGQDGFDGLDGPYDVTISPDGKYVYTAAVDESNGGGAVGVFSRNTTTGKLSFVQKFTDNALSNVQQVAVSPDGNNLYAAGWEVSSLPVFSRDTATGALSLIQVINTGLSRPVSVTASPDGMHVYVADFQARAVVAFRRNTTSRQLNFVQTTDGIDELNGVHSIPASPDGRHIYAASKIANALVVFNRDPTTGELSKVQTLVDGVDGLKGAWTVTVSPDGKSVYTAGRIADQDGDAVAVFQRDANSGQLTLLQVLRNGVDGVNGLDGAVGATITPDGKHVYVGGFDQDTLVVFNRAPSSAGIHQVTIAVGQTVQGLDFGNTTDHNNIAPVATADAYADNEDAPLNVAAAGVLANDTDVEGDPLTAVLVAGPANAAAFTLNADGSFRYTPNTDFNGVDSFTYRGTDGTANSAISTVTITVNPVNDLPTITDIGDQMTDENVATGAISFTVGDEETAADSLTVTAISSNPSLVPNGNITLGASGADRTITLIPAANQSGTTTITVTISDGMDSSNDSFLLAVIEDPAKGTVRMYRAYNPNADFHFFTTRRAEFDNAVQHGYRDESTGKAGFGVIPEPVGSATPIYRVYNLQRGSHYYTLDSDEKNRLVNIVPPPTSGPDTRTTGWRDEGIEGYMYAATPGSTAPSGTTTVHRLYNNNSGMHLFTKDIDQRNDILVKHADIWVEHNPLGYGFTVDASGQAAAHRAPRQSGSHPRFHFPIEGQQSRNSDNLVRHDATDQSGLPTADDTKSLVFATLAGQLAPSRHGNSPPKGAPAVAAETSDTRDGWALPTNRNLGTGAYRWLSSDTDRIAKRSGTPAGIEDSDIETVDRAWCEFGSAIGCGLNSPWSEG